MWRFLLLFLVLHPIISWAQINTTAIESQQHAIQIAVDNYKAQIGNGAAIYNGLQHIKYPSNILGFAYFGSPGWQEGRLLYDGILYSGVSLKFDLVADMLVINRPDNLAINLFSERVKTFSLGGHDFIYHAPDKLDLKAGFYELIAAGAATILCKRVKLVNEKMTTSIVESKFVEFDQYFVIKDGKVYAIKNTSSILSFAGTQRKELRKHMRRNGVRFKREPVKALKTIAAYYNH